MKIQRKKKFVGGGGGLGQGGGSGWGAGVRVDENREV